MLRFFLLIPFLNKSFVKLSLFEEEIKKWFDNASQEIKNTFIKLKKRSEENRNQKTLQEFGQKIHIGLKKGADDVSNFFTSTINKIETPIRAKIEERDEKLLNGFKNIMKLSKRAEIIDIARSLRITQRELYTKLLLWGQQLSFKIDGKSIIINDTQDYISKLDENFTEWAQNEKNNLNKLE
jgi:hypothetical protein